MADYYADSSVLVKQHVDEMARLGYVPYALHLLAM